MNPPGPPGWAVCRGDRRAGGLGQEHLGAGARRTLRLGLSRHRGALSRDRLSGAAGGGRSGRPGAGGRGRRPGCARSALRSSAARRAGRFGGGDRLRRSPAVRHALLAWQQDFAMHPPPAGARARSWSGRDIGTVVCPAAERKSSTSPPISRSAPSAGSKSCARAAPRLYTKTSCKTSRNASTRDRGRRDTAALGGGRRRNHRDDGARCLPGGGGPSAPAELVARALAERAFKGEGMALELQTGEASAKENFAALL